MSGPRVGFLGVGWIGRNRMEAAIATGAIEAAAIADPSPDGIDAARKLAPSAAIVANLDEMLALKLDGIVIATPSALHAEQAIAALRAGSAVFCQKPLGRTADETRAVVEEARRVNRLLGVDLSYRHTDGAQRIRELVATGELGDIFAADLTFHNAYGPDKPWFHDRAQSGGGCVMDLGIHLVDLALWMLDFPSVRAVSGTLFAKGERLVRGDERVEDFATGTITLESGAVVRLACSWNLPAGQDAVISADFYGKNGGAALRNVNGSFYDFTAERFRGTSRETLATPPDAWGGRAVADWARRLAAGEGFAAEAAHFVAVSDVLDRLYDSD